MSDTGKHRRRRKGTGESSATTSEKEPVAAIANPPGLGQLPEGGELPPPTPPTPKYSKSAGATASGPVARRRSTAAASTGGGDPDAVTAAAVDQQDSPPDLPDQAFSASSTSSAAGAGTAAATAAAPSSADKEKRKRRKKQRAAASDSPTSSSVVGPDDGDDSSGKEFAALLEMSDDDAADEQLNAKILELREQVKDGKDKKTASAASETSSGSSSAAPAAAGGKSEGSRIRRRKESAAAAAAAAAAVSDTATAGGGVDQQQQQAQPSSSSGTSPPLSPTSAGSATASATDSRRRRRHRDSAAAPSASGGDGGDGDDDQDMVDADSPPTLPSEPSEKHARRRRRKHKTEQELADDLVEEQILNELNERVRAASISVKPAAPPPVQTSAPTTPKAVADPAAPTIVTTSSGGLAMSSRNAVRSPSLARTSSSDATATTAGSEIAAAAGPESPGGGLARSSSFSSTAPLARRGRVNTGGDRPETLGPSSSEFAAAGSSTPDLMADAGAVPPGSPSLMKMRLTSRGSRRNRAGTEGDNALRTVSLDEGSSSTPSSPLLGDRSGTRRTAAVASPVRVRRQFAASGAVTAVWTTENAQELTELRRLLAQRAARLTLSQLVDWLDQHAPLPDQAGALADTVVRFTPAMSVAGVLRILGDRYVDAGALWDGQEYQSTLATADFVVFLLSVYHGPKENSGYVRFGLEQVRAVVPFAKPKHQPRLHRPSDSLSALTEDLRHASSSVAVLDENGVSVQSLLSQQHLLRFVMDSVDIVSSAAATAAAAAVASGTAGPDSSPMPVSRRTLLLKLPLSKLPVFVDTDLVLVSRKTTASEAFRLMLSRSQSNVGVVDEAGRLLGQTNLAALRFVTAETFDRLDTKPLAAFFTSHSAQAKQAFEAAAVCTPDDVLADAVAMLLRQYNAMGVVWVVNNRTDRKPVGLLTIFRLLQYLMSSVSAATGKPLAELADARPVDDAAIPPSLGYSFAPGSASPQLGALKGRKGALGGTLARSGSFSGRASSFVRSRLSGHGSGLTGSGGGSGGGGVGSGSLVHDGSDSGSGLPGDDGGDRGDALASDKSGLLAGSGDDRLDEYLKGVGPGGRARTGSLVGQSRWDPSGMPQPKKGKLSVLRTHSVLWLLMREKPDSAVPAVIDECCGALLSHIDDRDVYRAPAPRSEMEPLLSFFDRRLNENTAPRDEPLPSSMATPRAMASLLLMWLHTVRIPLLPFSLYDQFARIAQEPPSLRLLSRIRMLLLAAPVAHQPSLARLLTFLHRVARHQSNETTVAQLASAFGPELIRARSENLNTVRNTLQLNSLVELMIMHGPQLALGLCSAASLRSMLPDVLKRTEIRKEGKTAKSGYLMKKGGGTGPLGGKWQKRYFLLKTDVLLYFKDADDETPAHSYPLCGDNVWCKAREGDKDEYQTHFVVRDAAGRETLLQTITPNPEDAEDWIEAIEKAIKIANSKDPPTPIPFW